MADALAELQSIIGAMDAKEIAELDRLIADELKRPWLPNPGPQADAYYSKADLLLYGGGAGGGKTDLIVGLAVGDHQRVVIFRRSYGELSDIAERFLDINGTRVGFNGQDMRYRAKDKLVEFGALEKPGSEKPWRGRAHDLICFDEGAELSQEKIAYVMGWLRSTDPKQRCRAIIASNPPTGGEGEWMLSWFAPWLDPLFPNPARPGELRWAYEDPRTAETVWTDGPGHTVLEGEEDPIEHLSRTFVPALLNDNPYLRETGYRARINNMPEPLRSQLLKGDFLVGRKDHAWQVIPTEWVTLAEERWKNAPQKRRPMIALALDAAGGGSDDSALASLHSDAWFAPVELKKSGEFSNEATISAELATWMLQKRRDNADLSADCTGGWGGGVRSHLKSAHDIDCAAVIFSAGSNRKAKDGKFGFKNLRADMYWSFREALDPEEGDEIMLPPDPRLKAELTAARFKIVGTDYQIEDKEAVRQRIGSSPDKADATVIAWHRRDAAAKAARKKAPARALAPAGGWMGR